MPVRFSRSFISAEAFEAAGVFDVDGDGVPDIVTGGFWYKGPDFRERFVVGDRLPRFSDYYDEFSIIPFDVDGDGRLDFVTGGWWGGSLRWRKNPGDPNAGWEEFVIADGVGNIETTRAWDIDGDGALEIVPNTPNSPLCAYRRIGPGQFVRHVLHSRPLGHGLGFGDIDGDGRGEFITPEGILKAPDAGPLSGEWTFSEEFELGRDASIPVLVVDLDGDGVNELIVGNSHSYGLSWWKVSTGSAGRRAWAKHPIDPFNSQYHDLQWADIDGDGQPELVTGKRYLAHCGRDPGEYDDLGIYIFKWTGAGFAKQVVAYGPPGVGKGCGIQFALADLRGTGRLDIVAPGKDGLVVFFNEGS